jgi:hypothetical protein
MAIPKYADPDRGPYQSGEQQTDHEKIHIVKNPLDAAELQTALDNASFLPDRMSAGRTRSCTRRGRGMWDCLR